MESIKVVEKSHYDDILIVFSARKTERGKFTFYKQVIDFPASIIFVNDYDTQWYLTGTPDFNNSLELVNYLLGKIYELRRENTKVYTLGSSMGAYAALLYGAILQVDKILALGPESHLCVPLGRSVESLLGQYPEGDGDIANLNYKTPANVLIISGNNDIPDLYCAALFRAGNKKINIKLINNHTHVVARYIHQKITLSQFIYLYFYASIDQVMETFELGSLVSKSEACAIKNFNERLMIDKKVLLHEKETLLHVAKTHQNWSMPQYYMGVIYYKERNMKHAIAYLKKALKVQPDLGRARFKLARTYLETNDLDHALHEARYLKEQNFTYSVGNLLSTIYERQQNIKAYQDNLQEMLSKITLKKAEKEKIEQQLQALSS